MFVEDKKVLEVGGGEGYLTQMRSYISICDRIIPLSRMSLRFISMITRVKLLFFFKGQNEISALQWNKLQRLRRRKCVQNNAQIGESQKGQENIGRSEIV